MGYMLTTEELRVLGCLLEKKMTTPDYYPLSLNALINAGVGSIEQLTKCTEASLSNFRGFGAKALDEVKATLAERGLSLADDSIDV